jgi:uncharacterized membrane protein YgcG
MTIDTTFQAFRRLTSILIVLALLLVVVSPAAAEDFGQPLPGQHIYDRSGLFTPAELPDLEARAAAVERAGAPIVVYYRLHEADYDETVADARELMDAWDVQTGPGARDGIVIFFNADPNDPRHGEFALVVGEAHGDGNLPGYERERIADEMQALLRAEQTAAAISHGLDEIAHDLTAGPPPPPEPSRIERIAADLSRGPLSALNIANLVLAACATVYVLRRVRQQPPRPSMPSPAPTTVPPGDEPPALAGALVSGAVGDPQIVGTILDLARRGLLAIEPEGQKRKVRVRLLTTGSAPSVADEGVAGDDRQATRSDRALNDFEQRLLASFAAEADQDGIVSSKRLGKVPSHWKPVRGALLADLTTRGWFDPAASDRRKPLYIVGAVLLLLAVIAAIIAIVGKQGWGALGVGLLVAAALFAFIAALRIPNTTATGTLAAVPWHGYRRGLKSIGKRLDMTLNLDDAMPYAVALNAAGALDKRLKVASKEGYAPAWLGAGLRADGWDGGFYPYWASFYGSVAPASSSSAGVGGASAGSGASGGSY